MKPEKILKALANKRRLEMLKYLNKNKEAVVVDIADGINLSVRATSKHLLKLTDAEILINNQKGIYVFYKLSQPVHPLVRLTISLL